MSDSENTEFLAARPVAAPGCFSSVFAQLVPAWTEDWGDSEVSNFLSHNIAESRGLREQTCDVWLVSGHHQEAEEWDRNSFQKDKEWNEQELSQGPRNQELLPLE